MEKKFVCTEYSCHFYDFGGDWDGVEKVEVAQSELDSEFMTAESDIMIDFFFKIPKGTRYKTYEVIEEYESSSYYLLVYHE